VAFDTDHGMRLAWTLIDEGAYRLCFACHPCTFGPATAVFAGRLTTFHNSEATWSPSVNQSSFSPSHRSMQLARTQHSGSTARCHGRESIAAASGQILYALYSCIHVCYNLHVGMAWCERKITIQ